MFWQIYFLVRITSKGTFLLYMYVCMYVCMWVYRIENNVFYYEFFNKVVKELKIDSAYS
jgi:hypothetical protein